MMETPRPKRKNLLLLVALIALLIAQPLLGHLSLAAGVLFDALFATISAYLFVIVFAERWQRRGALALALPALASNFGFYILPHRVQAPLLVAFHCFTVLFLSLAVSVILGDIFRKKVIGGDEVLGAFCGYMLGGIVWANIYTMTYLLAPASFSVNPAIQWRLAEPHLRRALFDYLSFATLTGLGYADITPVGAPASSLTWMEVLFGQFYMAAVVAQLVGLKLAGALKGGGSDSR
jgi:voltage-gated potassium channel